MRTRSGSSISDKKSISMGPSSSSNAGLDSAKVYRMAATTVALLVGFASLIRFWNASQNNDCVSCGVTYVKLRQVFGRVGGG